MYEVVMVALAKLSPGADGICVLGGHQKKLGKERG